MPDLVVEVDRPRRADVRALLEQHLADMFATSPAESVHALDVTGLEAPGVTVWSAREGPRLLGCGALKELDRHHGEIKSMRTVGAARGVGVASAVLRVIVGEAGARGYERLSLETGTQDFFAPARAFYRRHGFSECGPFGDYVLDPSSVFLTRSL